MQDRRIERLNRQHEKRAPEMPAGNGACNLLLAPSPQRCCSAALPVPGRPCQASKPINCKMCGAGVCTCKSLPAPQLPTAHVPISEPSALLGNPRTFIYLLTCFTLQLVGICHAYTYLQVGAPAAAVSCPAVASASRRHSSSSSCRRSMVSPARPSRSGSSAATQRSAKGTRERRPAYCYKR